MLDVKYIRNNKEKVKQGFADKNVEIDLDGFLETDNQRRSLIQKIEDLRFGQNKITEEISKKYSDILINQSTFIKQELEHFEKRLAEINEKFNKFLLSMPNLPLDDVPKGKDGSSNVEIKKYLEPTKFDFEPKSYVDMATNFDIIDVARASKVSGSRFGYLKNEAVRLEFALVQYALDFLLNDNELRQIIKDNNLNLKPSPFVPVVPPVLIKPEMMRAMGYVERGGDEIYFLEKDGLYLVGTSEQSIGPMHANEILEFSSLPLRYVSFSTCFRREAGSYGKDTKGILRVHQFDKLEMFSLTEPSNSKDEHKLFLACEEKLMQDLKLPYRVLNICTGDLGDPAAAKYDIETWIPSENKYRETHSTSNTTDFQARRLNIRYKRIDEMGKTMEFVHMLNGTFFAVGRILIAIFENYQQKDGSIKIPQVLQKYTGFDCIKR